MENIPGEQSIHDNKNPIFDVRYGDLNIPTKEGLKVATPNTVADPHMS
jgi:hypothetical protein